MAWWLFEIYRRGRQHLARITSGQPAALEIAALIAPGASAIFQYGLDLQRLTMYRAFLNLVTPAGGDSEATGFLPSFWLSAEARQQLRALDLHAATTLRYSGVSPKCTRRLYSALI